MIFLVTLSEDGFYTIIAFPFICKPFMYSEEKEVVLSANTTVDYKGDYKCQPIFKFSGTGTHTITCNGESFTVECTGNDITVDCCKGIVYYNDITNAMEQFDGDMISFNPKSINTISWSATDGSAVPRIIYQDVSLCKRQYAAQSY